MNETRTAAMLQRVPAILAVTANSYGLILKAGGTRRPEGGERRAQGQAKAQGDKPMAHR